MIKRNNPVSLVYLPAKFSTAITALRIPLGLLYLGAVAKENGFEVNFFDFQNPKLSILDIERSIPLNKKHIVGFYCDSDNISRVITVSDRLLDTFPNIFIILGGPHVTNSPNENFLSERRIIVRGEGEYPFALLTKLLINQEGFFNQIPSITFKKDGKLFSNPISLGPFIDVDKCPEPDYDLLDEGCDYSPVILTSRGCLYNCHFCSDGQVKNAYCPRSINGIRKELFNLRDRCKDVEHLYIQFTDDTFTAILRYG